jgi:chorismate mutase/prephenate dehydratase
MDKAAPNPLQAIRQRIDSIDEQIHRLLIDRSGVIAELIRIKGTSAPGAAFRPDREAEMMRRLAARHQGALPLTTVEHIWREIITTFTAMQAPFGVLAPPAADPLALRDVIRFYFGFSVPIGACASVEEAIGQVASSGREIAVVPANSEGRWWDPLKGASAPKIFAKLPFIEVANRPAALPAYVIGPPLRDVSTADVQLFSVSADAAFEGAATAHGGSVAGRGDGEILIELPVAVTLDDLQRAAPAKSQMLGGFAQPIRHLAERMR